MSRPTAILYTHSHAVGMDRAVEVAHAAAGRHGWDLVPSKDAEGHEPSLFIVLGGDGTINEVVNGLRAFGPGPEVPALATVPGGSANVLVRAVGLPRDPVEATGVLLAGLHDSRWRDHRGRCC